MYDAQGKLFIQIAGLDADIGLLKTKNINTT